MPTFDIVSEIETAELKNATQNTERELATRYDFRGVTASIKLEKDIIKLAAEGEMQVNQLLDMLRSNLTKRGIDPQTMDYSLTPEISGKTYSIPVSFKQGIEKDIAKKIVKLVKDSKIKVQVAIQGDQLRVTGKKRDDLQATMTLLRGADINQPLQFNNFRD